jgi:hypothetical protein
MMAVGMLIAGLSGLCSGAILYEDIGNPNANWAEGVWIVALIGGIPFLTGLGMAIGGWLLLKKRHQD